MNKTLLIIIVGLLFMAACQQKQVDTQIPTSSSSSENSPKNEPQPFKVVESAYKVSSGFGNHYLKWAVILENPNSDYYGLFPTITITGRDENGNIVGTEDQVLSEFPPGIKIAAAGQMSLTKHPKTLDFTVAKIEWRNTVTKPADYVPFSVNKITFNSKGKDTVTVSGDVSNPYDKDIEQIAVTSLLRDSDDKLIGGNTTYVDSLPRNGSRPYSDEYIIVTGKPAKAEVFVIPHGAVLWNKLVSEKK